MIAFSNSNWYGSNLVFFPAAVSESKDLGIQYTFVPDAVNIEENRNKKEALSNAKKVIRETFNFSASKPVKLKKIIKTIKSNYNSKSIVRNLKSNKKSFTVSIKKIKSKLNFYPENTENIILRNL